MIEQARVGVWSIDGEGNTDYVNQALCRMLGYSAAEMLGRRFTDFLASDRTSWAEATFDARKAGMSEEGGVCDLIAKDGRAVRIRYDASPLKDEDGTMAGALSVVTELAAGRAGENLAERLRSEELLQQVIREKDDALQRFRELADSMPQIVWGAGADGKIDYRNWRWYEQTGQAQGDLRDAGEFVHPDDRPLVSARWAESVATGDGFEYEIRLKFPHDEDYRWYLSRAVPVRSAAGEIMRWYGTHTDIHERKAAERSLARANQNKDEFLAKLAHELRNPLGATQAAIELFKVRLPADSPLHRQRAVIERQAQHMVRLIEDLSDVARIGAGKIDLRRQRVDLGAIAAEALDAVRAAAASRQHELIVDLIGEPLMVDGDPARLMQVMVNLLTNAIKYTASAGRIDFAVRREGDGAVVRVRDNGTGIRPETLGTIFDLYNQGEAAPDGAAGGLGIGLHLVQNLVRLHGGTVTAASDGLGKGSTFEVRLPLAP